MTPLYRRTATITGQSLDQTDGGHGGSCGKAQAPPARAELTLPYSLTATITGPSLDRTGGEHGGIAQAPLARAGLTQLYSRTATITGPSLDRTGGEQGWPERAEALRLSQEARASRLAPRAERSASAPSRRGASGLSRTLSDAHARASAGAPLGTVSMQANRTLLFVQRWPVAKASRS